MIWPPWSRARPIAGVTAALVAIFLLPGTASQETTASVSGMVVSAATNRPIANASVSLFPVDSDAGRGLRTNANGEFTFDRLAPGRYWLGAEAAGHLRASFGAVPGLRPTPVAVAAGRTQTGLVIRLHRGGSISGTVVDDAREPVVGIGMRAFVRRFEDGAARFQPAAAAETDDRGAFRIFGLEPGQYIVAATNAFRPARGGAPRAPDTDAVVTTFAPATTDPAAATVITVGLDQERDGLAIQTKSARGSIIDGRLSGPGAAGSPGLTVSLLATPRIVQWPPVTERPQPGGRFTFTHVAPGRYWLVAHSAADPAIPRVWGAIPVVVDPGVTIPMSIALRSDGGRITGEAVSKTGAVLNNLSFGLRPIAGGDMTAGGTRATVGVDGRFVMDQIPPGTYGWIGPPVFAGPSPVVSVTIDGKDVSDLPLVVAAETRLEHVTVTISDQWSTIQGQVTDAAGRPTTAGAIVVYSTESRDWTPASRKLRDTRADTDGHYEVLGLPAGEYVVAPVSRVEPGQVFDPGFLKAVSGGIRVKLGPAETRTVGIRLPPKFHQPASKHPVMR